MPVRWVRASSKVVWLVAYISCRTKSSGRIACIGVVHSSVLLTAEVESGFLTGLSSSTSRETAAAVNDFVVLAA